MKCYNCGQLGPTITQSFDCEMASCRNEISISGDESLDKKDFGVLCPAHRRVLILTSPTALETELKKENRTLQSSLALREKDQADLQAELRALETKLNEQESSSPWPTRITELTQKIKLVKHKLTEWTKLIKHDQSTKKKKKNK